MELKNLTNNFAKVVLPLTLGGAILYWMYRGFDFKSVRNVLFNEMDWTWMLLSFPFGILAQIIRGWRWRLTLNPVGEYPRLSVSINSIFLSYASSLVVPRIGEFTRCGILKRYDDVSFPKSLGTVVTERAIDSLLVMVVAGITLLLQFRVFGIFFDETGTSIDSLFSRFSPAGYAVTALCGAVALGFFAFLLKRLSIYNKVKTTLSGIWQGVMSLRRMDNVPLFVLMTIGIWACYFLHYYLAFFCFGFTENLGMACGMVTFVVGSIAVLVPTPNGAGPWHFAVKTMLILYGVADEKALYFVLIVHSVQTMLVVLLGIWAWVGLMFTGRRVAARDMTVS
ncbi:lysylphosphatidylglycerol synthase transmembrane domain-containing protein [Xylanibacter muris]|uniref:Flippase-like domain-containing protein n=1 Tax=Xylanibacter muris TaxID=2736290 RepID=A0ABX2AJM8_9BACT|nr:lysylphosphatidylglycerol synthase transmembrane domain-containing protein [Xylanibacter muris]NPD91209.1 flippase-like domain-containing protein [Xylanibacter muris]